MRREWMMLFWDDTRMKIYFLYDDLSLHLYMEISRWGMEDHRSIFFERKRKIFIETLMILLDHLESIASIRRRIDGSLFEEDRDSSLFDPDLILSIPLSSIFWEK